MIQARHASKRHSDEASGRRNLAGQRKGCICIPVAVDYQAFAITVGSTRYRLPVTRISRSMPVVLHVIVDCGRRAIVEIDALLIADVIPHALDLPMRRQNRWRNHGANGEIWSVLHRTAAAQNCGVDCAVICGYGSKERDEAHGPALSLSGEDRLLPRWRSRHAGVQKSSHLARIRSKDLLGCSTPGRAGQLYTCSLFPERDKKSRARKLLLRRCCWWRLHDDASSIRLCRTTPTVRDPVFSLLLFSQQSFSLRTSALHSSLGLDMSPLGPCSEGKLAWFDEASIPALCWIGYPIPAVVLPIATCLLFALSKCVQYQKRQLQWRQPEKYQQYDHDHVRPSSWIRQGNRC